MNGGAHEVASVDTVLGAPHSWHWIPNVLKVEPVQPLHVDRSIDGSVPAPHGSHAVWPSLATFPGSSHEVQSAPPELTLPIGHGVQSLDSDVCVEQPLFVLLHSWPAAHRNGAMQDVLSTETTLGAAHSWQL